MWSVKSDQYLTVSVVQGEPLITGAVPLLPLFIDDSDRLHKPSISQLQPLTLNCNKQHFIKSNGNSYTSSDQQHNYT